MRISLKWLAEYVALPAPEELARRLTAVGLEVEGIERLGAGLSGVVAARIVAVEKHPNAEKLSVTRVESGSGEPLQIVCGARNVRVGDVVPLATLGTALPGGQRIEKAKLRGVESFGMLCSERELGLATEATGLYVLPPEIAPGTPIAQALGLEDVAFEINVTPNRPDALSHVGIAREVSAIFGTPVKMPRPRLEEQGPPASEGVLVRIEAPDRCHRYAARVIEGVRIGPSPAWLARRLEACGVRSISNVVDATNFVLLELGHPLHAFDLDKVAGHEIVVRKPRAGERMTTLDGQERVLDPDDLVIADRDRASALAGVMGGGDSEISAGTRRVLLESAWFEPAGVRRTSRRHGLHTEASHRFERGADPGMVLPALDRCAALIAELAGGTVRPGIVDENPRPFRAIDVRLRWSRPREILGTEVPREEARRILGGLGFTERQVDDAGAIFRVPSWRVDVSLEEDLVEEITRLQGYDSIPETLPALAHDATPAVSVEAQAIARARTALEASGFSEVVNFSFVSPGELRAVDPDARPVALKNPISAELSVMRTTLVASVLRNAAYNLRQGTDSVRLYELASVYLPAREAKTDPPADERRRISGVMLGRRSPLGWAVGSEPVDFYDLKASLESVLTALGSGGIRYEPASAAMSWLHPRSACVITQAADGKPLRLGEFGELHPRVAQAFELPRGVFAFELDVDALARNVRLTPIVRPIPRFPAVLRDLAVVVAEAVPAGQVTALVRDEPLVEDVTLFDVYRGAPIPQGKKNLALAIRYRAPDRTLTDAEADRAHARIVERLVGSLGAELRA